MACYIVWYRIIAVVISFILDGKTTPICIAFSYIAGFVVGIIFQTDGIDPGGARTNNLWIIWTVVFICLTLAGIIYDKFISTAKKENSLSEFPFIVKLNRAINPKLSNWNLLICIPLN